MADEREDIVVRLREFADLLDYADSAGLVHEAAATITRLREEIARRDARHGPVDGNGKWCDELIAEVDALEEKWDIELYDSHHAHRYYRDFEKAEKALSALKARVRETWRMVADTRVEKDCDCEVCAAIRVLAQLHHDVGGE